MSAVFLAHPDGWIGIPEEFPGDGWATEADWARELVDVLHADFGEPGDGEADGMRSYLETLAGSREDREASRIYVWIEGWSGPVYVADLIVADIDSDDVADLEELAGANDGEAVEKPVIEPFVTDSGLVGLVGVRYLNPASEGELVARRDYVWMTPAGVVRLYTAQFDLVAFDRAAPRMEALARTVRVE